MLMSWSARLPRLGSIRRSALQVAGACGLHKLLKRSVRRTRVVQ